MYSNDQYDELEKWVGKPLKLERLISIIYKLLNHDVVPASVLAEEFHVSQRMIAHALSHLYAVEKTWYLVVKGTGMREAFEACIPINETPLSSVEEYAELFVELAESYTEWFRSQTDLEQVILLDNPFAAPRQTRLSEIVLQVVNHGTYHRGNVSTMLRQLGHASTMNDYCLYWYQDQAGGM